MHYKRRNASILERLMGIAQNNGWFAAIRWALNLPMGWGKALFLLGVLIAVGVRIWWNWPR